MFQSHSPSRISPAITNKGEKKAHETGKLEGFWRQEFNLGNCWNDTEGKAKWQLTKKNKREKRGKKEKQRSKDRLKSKQTGRKRTQKYGPGQHSKRT